MLDEHYLKLLSKEYPTIQSAATEIINLKSVMSLPKGTEYFFSDIHGEHKAFLHLLRSASGMIRKKIDDLFGRALIDSDRGALASLITTRRNRSPLCGTAVRILTNGAKSPFTA